MRRGSAAARISAGDNELGDTDVRCTGGQHAGRELAVRIEVLGPLRVLDDAGGLVRVGGPRVRALLIALALDPGAVVPVPSLLRQLGDAGSSEAARGALQARLSRLRAALRGAGLPGDLVESHPAGYRLAITPADVDAAAFEALAAAGARALAAGDVAEAGTLLREALALWRGPALADVAEADFAVAPAARLERLRQAAQLDRIEADIATASASDAAGLATQLEALVAVDPLDERPRALQMRALYAAGRQAEALAVYEQARALLSDQLGVDPSPQLASVHLAVLRQTLHDGQPPASDTDTRSQRLPEPAAVAAPRNRMHAPLTSFVGRERDIEAVVRLLTAGRLVTLTGPGGAGKTRLATEAAMALTEERFGLVRIIELAPLGEAGEIPHALLAAFGIREAGLLGGGGYAGSGGRQPRAADPLGRLVTALADLRGVLVLDNCEHLVDDVATLADRILAGCPDARILATSREPLAIAGELLWPVPPLSVPPPVPPRAVGAPAAAADAEARTLSGYAAARLLADRASAARPGFEISEANAADVTRICRALDGMPLAIELAAARLRSLSLAELSARLSERLEGRFGLLTGGSRTATARHQTLRAVVDWSWELLSAAEQAVACQIAVFPGGATLAAAEEVCAGAASQPVLDSIRGLVDKSFLAIEDGGAEPRYRMLETIRAYCLDRLAADGQLEAARVRASGYYLGLAERAEPLLRTSAQRRWFNLLADEGDNIHAAVRFAVERGDQDTALAFCRALGWYWLLGGHQSDSGRLARAVLAMPYSAAAPRGRMTADMAAESRAICALIAASRDLDADLFGAARGQLTDALAAAQRAVTERLPHPIVSVGQAIVAMIDRDNERALNLIASHIDNEDPWVSAAASLMHSFFELSLGHVDVAAAGCERATAGFRAIGEVWGTAMGLLQQGEIAKLRGDDAAAIAALDEAAELGGELSAWEDLAQIYGSLAGMKIRTGDYEGASADLGRAERTARYHPEAEFYLRLIRAELEWQRGNPAEARRICRQMLTDISGKTATTWTPMRALVQARLGVLAGLDGDPAQGRELLRTAVAVVLETNDRPIAAMGLEGLAGIAAADGDAERAAELLGAADSVRGTVDYSSLDAPAARSAAREKLGQAGFDACYQRGHALSFEDAIALAAR
jgi:predicted ATPase/DNA-binding SARP family transcriptional activator